MSFAAGGRYELFEAPKRVLEMVGVGIVRYDVIQPIKLRILKTPLALLQESSRQKGRKFAKAGNLQGFSKMGWPLCKFARREHPN